MTNAKYRKSKRDNLKKDEGSSRSLKSGFSKDVPMPNDESMKRSTKSSPSVKGDRSLAPGLKTGLYTLVAVVAVMVFGLAGYGALAYYKNENHKKELSEEQAYLGKLVDIVNRGPNCRWKAKFNPFGTKVRNTDYKTLRNVTAVKEYVGHIRKFFESDMMKQHIKKLQTFSDSKLPRHFDSRQKWSFCPSLHQVLNQGACGSCFAIASMGVASDRTCIQTNGTFRNFLSAQDVVGCCYACGNCLTGGDPLKALVYWVVEGVVTGGPDGCQPYAIDTKCGIPCRVESYELTEKKRQCHRNCQSNYYKSTYKEDKSKGVLAYTLYPRKMTVDQAGKERIMMPSIIGNINETMSKPLTTEQIRTIIRKELFLFGPTTLAFPITEEFLHYDSGIYHPFPEQDFEKRIIYWHVVRLVGWGHDEADRLYWIAINSWGDQWGENGRFRVDTSLVERFGLEYETGLFM